MIKYIIYIIVTSFLFSDSFDGLTLITGGEGGGGQNQPKYTHLIDNNQNIIKSWSHDTSPASIAYLTSDSILYVPCKLSQGAGPGVGPSGGRFKKMNWEGNVIWDYSLPTDICMPHHDIEVLPNGNILAICSETKTQEEAVSAGRQNLNGSMTLDMIIEIQPIGNNQAEIVWEWHFWDHLIQDINPFNENYGVLSENPRLLDINSQSSGGGGNGGQGINDWNHLNCISYNSNFDQIAISSRHMNEFYVIDHSTTTIEAASHSGGNYGFGGDFLYRWGNPQNYNIGSSQILSAQHGVNWIPDGYPGEGKFILFNNNHSNGSSAILEVNPPMNNDGSYQLNDSGYFGPSSFDWIYQPGNLYSNSQSGAFRLPNGNTIITSANQSNVFEIDLAGDIQWSYQGELNTVRAIKYPLDYLDVDSGLAGDMNNDQILNVLDVIQLVNIVLLNNYDTNGDLNQDGTLDILDIVTLVNIILG